MSVVSPPPALQSPVDVSPSVHSPRANSRRPSWILSIGAKLSSLSSGSSEVEHAAVPPCNQPTASSVSISVDGTTSKPPKDSVQTLSAAINSALNESRPQPSISTSNPESSPPQQNSAQSISSTGSFFSSALKRLSASRTFGSGGGAGGSAATVPTPTRRVLNVNQDRARCHVPELGDAGKLRRVAFCVDVNIAAPASWPPTKVEKDKQAGNTPTSIPASSGIDEENDPSLAALASGDPVAVFPLLQKSNDKNKWSTEGTLERTISAPAACTCEPTPSTTSPGAANSRRWRRSLSSSSSTPPAIKRCKTCTTVDPVIDKCISTAPIHIDGRPSSNPKQTLDTPSDPPNKHTTDPLRIYRRCCQLRETPVLKRIADQLSALRTQLQQKQTQEDKKPSPLNLNAPPIVPVLDLSNSCLQPADFITLADWLAIVPVRRLILENADIRDEALRAVLSGLLAAKNPVTGSEPLEKDVSMGGVIESLNLCRNRHLSPASWKQISLFIHMCTSLKVIDLSYIPFPQSPDVPATRPACSVSAVVAAATVPSSPSSPKGGKGSILHIRNHSRTPSEDSVGTVPPLKVHPPSMGETFAKALRARRAGSTLEEIRLGNCGLTAPIIRRIIDATIVCGVHRLSLAGNKLDAPALHYVALYAKSGVCQGLDLAGNDIRAYVPLLANCFGEIADRADPSSIWGLCLARCNLDGRSLQELLPNLSRLKNLRFLDLSHNKRLMASPTGSSIFCPSKCMNPGLAALRKWIPQCKMLRRLHLADISLSPTQAMALLDIVPDTPALGFLDIKDNPALDALADAESGTDREEAYALFASLAAATRASRSILRIDIALPSERNGEVVKALARQAAAACLRNLGFWTEAVMDNDPQATMEQRVKRQQRKKQRRATRNADGRGRSHAEHLQKEKSDGIIDEAMQKTQNDDLIGPAFASGRYSEVGPNPERQVSPLSNAVFDHESDDGNSCHSVMSSDSEDYSDCSVTADNLAIRAPGVTKALDFYLSQDIRQEPEGGDSSTVPRTANEMTKHLLSSARRIRSRLQVVLNRVAKDPAHLITLSKDSELICPKDGAGLAADDFILKRLQFLDTTLKEMIQRFESEFPECKQTPKTSQQLFEGSLQPLVPTTPRSSTSLDSEVTGRTSTTAAEGALELVVPNEEYDPATTALRNHRNQSDVSLAHRVLVSEEGRAHRISIQQGQNQQHDDELEGATVVSTDGDGSESDLDDEESKGLTLQTPMRGNPDGIVPISTASRAGPMDLEMMVRVRTV